MTEWHPDTGDETVKEPRSGRTQAIEIGLALLVATGVLLTHYGWNFLVITLFNAPILGMRAGKQWLWFLIGLAYLPFLIGIALQRRRRIGTKAGLILGCAAAILLNGMCWDVIG